ncbi:MAG: formate/nitrite transporter family protein [Gimesia chilikensis]|uniref:formate/nitrite transporter family protein n=1 Tax=Gimesia chilikensis TaxID=2605989 RepID=UPI0037BE2072
MNTATDLQSDGLEEAKKAPGQILQAELVEAMDALTRSSLRLFLSGLSAGLDIGFSLFLVAVVQTLGQGSLSEPVLKLLVGMMYSFGFILVVVGRSELFTEQTSLAILPLLSRQASFRMVIRLWGIVYVANLIGAMLFAVLVVIIGPALGVIDVKVFGELSRSIVAHPGWLMGLLSWLVYAGRDTISQILIVFLITSVIGLGHLHHCIVGSVEVLAGVFADPGTTLADYGHFLLWTTAGNALGGVIFVSLLKYGHAHASQYERKSKY